MYVQLKDVKKSYGEKDNLTEVLKGISLDTEKMKGLKGNRVLFSDGYYEKYNMEEGEPVEMEEEFTSEKYVLKAGGRYKYPASLAVFMDIEQFRRIFETEEDHYSGYFSDSELKDIPGSDIASVITEEDLLTTSNQLEDSMGTAFRLFLIFSIIMFILMIYLLAKLVTERNAYEISMLKILGYTNREAGSLYQSATGIAVVISMILSGIFGIQFLKWIYYMLMQSYNGWMTFYVAPWGVPALIGTGLASYGLVNIILMRKIRKIPMTDALRTI